MISNVNGIFSKFNATMESANEDFVDAKINFSTEVSSISTNITDRDNHLKSPDFFDVEVYPEIKFRSTNIIKRSNTEYIVIGDLTIKNVTRSVSLSGTYNGNDVDPYGQTKYGFELGGEIKRSDFGLNFNVPGGKGSLVIGDEVKLLVSVQMMEKND
jgi:polyisoprenoid-binding protein YceI